MCIKFNFSDVKGLKIFEVGEKYYFQDLGLRYAIRSFDYRSDVSNSMENVVYLHLKKNNFNVFVGKHADKEIDFMAERKGERIYLLVCYMLSDQKTIDREFDNLLSIDDNYPKYVVTIDEISSGTNLKCIHHVHLREFLSSMLTEKN